ncbi:hypothetical protein DL764_004815 [Monosporascus ibericus]|uniref:Uncharacterized protein n=1 Tax=Monosporascus ibericus TaxID=155417 RepID=A0A4V1XAT8_9PEZI|nr:hypothetical protein DL764_004815 [Monosporascus ibericus]
MASFYVFRHAEGKHNKFAEFRKRRDLDLTELGRRQRRGSALEFPYMDKVTHLVSSPMHRAIHSTLLPFAPLRIRPSELLREFGNKVDLGRGSEAMEQARPEQTVRYGLEKIEARTAAARE